MRQVILGLGLVVLLIGFAQAQQAPAPPAVELLPGEKAVHDFYRQYWAAWEALDHAALAQLISRDYTGTTFVPGRGIVHEDYTRALAAVATFFETIRGQQMAWSRNLLSIMVRSETEAVAAIRTGFVLLGLGQSELSLEVLRREADGQWRLVRRWSEKHLQPGA